MAVLTSTGRLIVLCGALLLAGCATTPPWPQPSELAAADRPQRQLLDDVPFYPQEKYQCGPAALATVLNAQGLDTRPEQLKELVYLPGREGSLQVEMVAAARAHDMVVYPLKPAFEAILDEVRAGHPVLVMQNLLLDWWPKWHFAVVVGYDSHRQTVILNTDTRQHYEMPYQAFYATWRRADHWARVVLPPDRLPATAKPLAYLRAAHDLETTGRLDAARTAYRTAHRHWPSQPEPLMALGNLAYDQQDWPKAVAHFLNASHRFPQFADAWNNLAYTLVRAGCPAPATQALMCAATLNPDRFQPSGPEFEATRAAPDAECPRLPPCPPPGE